MSLVDKITTYKTDAVNRLMTQYSESNIQDIINTYSEQIQEIENILFNGFYSRLSIDDNIGEQLDRIGEILKSLRAGNSDSDYRTQLKGKISQNISEGTAENLISLYKIFTGATQVRITEYFPAEISLMSNGTLVPRQEAVVKASMKKAAAGGVKIYYIGTFDETSPFSFGPTSGGVGFGDLLDPGNGGILGSVF